MHKVFAPTTTPNCALIFHVIGRKATKMQIFFGRFKKGIGYYTPSGRPIDLVFLIIAPPSQENEFKKLVEQIEAAMLGESLRSNLRTVKNKDKAVKIIVHSIPGIEK